MKRSDLSEQQIASIKKHWDDSEFDVIRRAFKNYIVCNGVFDDEYLNAIAYLLGIDMEHSYDGYDLWWDFRDPDYIKFMKL
jgi:hypothetical protein